MNKLFNILDTECSAMNTMTMNRAVQRVVPVEEEVVAQKEVIESGDWLVVY